MLRLLRASLLFAFTLSTAHAQTLSGQITDGETGAPLPGATVFLPTTDLGTTSDAEGRYALTLPAPGAFRVVFSFVGYKTETRSVVLTPGGTATLDVVLTPSFVEVGDVTVTAKANAADLLSTPQSVAILDERALDRDASGTPLDALDDVAGVRLLRTGPAIAKPVIRGLTAQRVLVVADGVRQEGQQWGDEHGPEIGRADVDRIEVVRGPLSLLYGSDALGGVVQTTHDGLFAYEAPLAGEATAVGLTGTNQGAADLTLGGRSGAWAYEARGGILRAGQIETPDGLLPNTAQENWTASGRLGVEWGPQRRVLLSGGWFETTLGLFEPEFLEGEAPDLGRYEIGEPSQRVQHGRLGLRADLPFGRNRVEIVTAVQQNRRREFGEHHGEEGGKGPEGGEEHGAEEPELFLRLTTATADARLHHRPVGRLFGTIGVSGMWQENETLAEETLIPSATTLNGAVYVTEEFVLPTLTLDAGLRFDARTLDVSASEALGVTAQTRNYTALTGALGLAWQPRGDLSLAANLGRAFRAPQLIELFGNGVHEGTLRFERGDADLVPESSLALDGVARYRTPHLYAEVSGFVNRISNYIFPRATDETDPESGFLIYDFAQADARLVGAEFRLDIHPHVLHGLGLHFSGDVTGGTNLETDSPLPFVPPARLRSAVEYKAEALGPARDVEARFGPTLVAAQDRPDMPEEIPTDAYAVWDLSLGAAFPSGGLTITPVLAVDNLFDAGYVDPLSRFRPYGVLAPGRTVRLSVRVGF